jgi:ATP-dependent helicase HrpA
VRAPLPIEASRDAIVAALRTSQVVVVAGETGSGKTTLVPRFLLEEGYCERGVIGVTEPRRVAAVSVASYVAGQFGEEAGGLVGYRIRHEDRTSDATLITYMTDGVLLRELLYSARLPRYSAVVLDEVHERNVNQDLTMALIKDLLPRRPDLKVVVMSATMEEDRFARYFGAEVVRIEGRTFPVSIEHEAEEPNDPVDAAAAKTVEMLDRTGGDALVFVPDHDSIRRVMEGLAALKVGAEVYPLYGNQSPEEQMRVFSRRGRSVIVATNVAETSVTLDGVTAVVDTGLVKEMRYFPRTGMSALKVVPHSRAGCEQRAGRAGRTAPGVCARLYTREDHDGRPRYTEPEIRRVSLDQVLLQMKAMGIGDARIRAFDFLDKPSAAAWDDAEASLRTLGAVDDDGALTDDGTLMSEIPLPPIVTRMIISADGHGCVRPVVEVAASFSTRPAFTRPPGREDEADAAHRKFRDPRSDHLTLLQALRAWRNAGRTQEFAERHFLHHRALEEIEATAAQIEGLLAERGIEASTGASPDDIGRAIASGLIGNLLTKAEGRSYAHRKRGGIFIHPGSSVDARNGPSYAVCAEVVETTRPYARGVQAVPRRWLEELLGKKGRKKRGKRREKRRERRRERRVRR